MATKTCFVVMGFGTKTDFTKPKAFNLDKTYRNIIKPAAIAAGLECVRADEIVHSGNINVPMYEQLNADVSTYNCNAFYGWASATPFAPAPLSSSRRTA